MKGPGMRINLIAVCNCKGVSTTESYVINNLVEVILKVEAVKNIDFKISMMANKCASAENDAITINIICKQLRYSKKLNYSDFVSIWIDIGETDGRWLQKLGHPVYLLSLEFIITVNTITKPAFLKLYEDKEWTDFTLSTADGKVAVHKACLAAHSPVFRAMFTGTWKEAKENNVEIKNYTLQTIQDLKDFLYLGTLPNIGLRPLLTLASLYSINDLVKECIVKLAETVQPEELYSLHEFAIANNIPELTWSISQLTPDRVINEGHEIKKNNENKTKRTISLTPVEDFEL